MKNAALILSALLLLSACQKKDQAAGSTNTTQTQTDTASTDTAATDTGTADTQASAATTPDTAAATTEPGALPSGYTLVPFLTDAPKREFTKEPSLTLQDGKDYYALIDTSKGQILIDLYEQETPVTVNNFVFLARNHFYDGVRFHRVIDGFMAQSGDPKSADETKKAEWGTGGPGYQFANEIRQKLTFNSGGILAMANSGPDTNGSQFFITFAAADFLNGGYNLFGKVVTGDDTLAKLTRTSKTEGQQEVPIEGAVPDQILTVRILTKN